MGIYNSWQRQYLLTKWNRKPDQRKTKPSKLTESSKNIAKESNYLLKSSKKPSERERGGEVKGEGDKTLRWKKWFRAPPPLKWVWVFANRKKILVVNLGYSRTRALWVLERKGISLAIACVKGIFGFGVIEEKATKDWTHFCKSQGSEFLFAYRKCYRWP